MVAREGLDRCSQSAARVIAMTQIALNFELPSEAPKRIELIPTGPRIVGRDGRAWLFDSDAQSAVLSAFAQSGLPLPVDINHSSEHKASKGDESPAVGWIERLEIVNGALWGDVEWNPKGLQAVANREYRFISPVFDFERGTDRIRRLCSVALVNNPNLVLQALNSEASCALTAFELSICRATGISAEAFAKSKNSQRAVNHSSSGGSLSEDELLVCQRVGISAEAFALAKLS